LTLKICSDICLRTLSVSRNEQKMSADKYPSIFSRPMEAIVHLAKLKPIYKHKLDYEISECQFGMHGIPWFKLKLLGAEYDSEMTGKTGSNPSKPPNTP